MTVLDLFNPTLSRTFTYYDRCAILLEPEEMVATRLRVFVNILGSPLERSKNLRYSLPKEFFGYAQFFWQTSIVGETPINYVESLIWDYWNTHSTIAHQLTEVFRRLGPAKLADLRFLVQNFPDYPGLQELADAISALLELTLCLEINLPGGESFLNTFVHPWNLLRLNFPFGTVFTVTIDSWTMSPAEPADFLPGNPNTDEPFDTDNPSGNNPDRTPGGSNPDQPYGPNPPESSPLDPRLDPDDFSNAPEPSPPPTGVLVRGWYIPAVPGVQTEAFAVHTLDLLDVRDIPGLENVQSPEDLGIQCIPRDETGQPDMDTIESVFPGFDRNTHFYVLSPDGPTC